MSFRTLRLCIASFGAVAISGFSMTIVYIGPPTGASRTSGVAAISATSFTTTADYENVNVSVWLGGGPLGANGTLQAFLTDQIGTGTTAANEIASISTNVVLPVTNTADDIVNVPLFSIPSLLADTYYLVIYSPDVFIFIGEGGTLTTASGVTWNTGYLQVGTIESYPPATDMPELSFFQMAFSVTGELPPSGVPEPTVFAMVGLGIVGLLVTRRLH